MIERENEQVSDCRRPSLGASERERGRAAGGEQTKRKIRRMHGRTDGWMDGWMDRWMDITMLSVLEDVRMHARL